MRRRRLISVTLVATSILAACGSSAENDGAATPATAAPATATQATAAAPDSGGLVVPASLQFTAPLIGGGEIDAATLAGKPTVFWFWAPT